MDKNVVLPVQIEFDAFMRKTIRNAVKGLLKKKKKEFTRREEMVDVDDLTDEMLMPAITPDALKNCVDIGDMVLFFERDDVAEAMGQLKDEYKLAIALRFFLKKDNENAGRFMEKDPDAFRKCLKRALISLGEELSGKGGNAHHGKK
ncbi:MAG: hypothetical protein J5802_03185 [Butyrivibrio sp.]|nr:hypothetical protein [Butyrivibrio sp.]